MAIGSLADVQAVWKGDALKQEVRRAAGRGLRAAAVFFSARVKEILSVPAPRKIVHGKTGAYYRATTPAIPGAPPRKLSGRLRASIAYEVGTERARVGTNVIYARRHERGTHPFLVPALMAHKGNLATIIGSAFGAK